MERRYARVSVQETIVHMIASGRPDIALTSDWPADAVVVGGNWDHEKGMMYLTLWSSIFDEVPVGNIIPDFTPSITAHLMEPPAQALIELIEAFKRDGTGGS